MTTIYLSSTYQDLKDHRAAVFDALRRSGYEVIAMEDYVARDDRPLEACLRDVDRADVYVGLFAFRYGYIPPVEQGNPDSHSITELEFRRADASANTPCLVFLLHEKAPWPTDLNDTWTGHGDKGQRIRSLRNDLSREKMASFFSGAYELASKVQAAVSKALRSTPGGAARREEPAPKTTWDVIKLGSPYPGLMHFTRRFAPVFFGRELEVRELLDRLTLPEGRFLIVSGDSGSGKSSLVDAGVLSRLDNAHLAGDRSLLSVRMVPSGGDDPFDALLRALHPFTEYAGLDGYRLGRDLAAGRVVTSEVLRDILTRGLNADGLFLFLDQMEELFTAAENDQPLVARFLSGLRAATQDLPLQVLASIRSDLLHHCYAHPDMLVVLNGLGHYALGRAAPHMLHDMILLPARCAGIFVPEALARRLIEDVGAEPGNLPLLAFVLQRLFEQRRDDALSEGAYEDLGGLTGAIAAHVNEVERSLEKDLGRKTLEELLAALFELLVRVDLEGLPTRRRVCWLEIPEALDPVVEVLIKARLLTGEGQGQERAVSISTERLFQAWPPLARWVAEHQDDLRLLRQGELDAAEWARHDNDLAELWHTDRLKRLQSVITSLPPERAGDALRAFAWPQQRLIRLLEEPELDHETRNTIGQYLAALGDTRPGVGVHENGTPDIYWVAVPGGEVELEDGAGTERVSPFHMSRFLVTNAQFQSFLDADDGYADSEWWEDMAKDANENREKPRWPHANRPRETVSWYEAVAFCRWLSRRLGFEVRLPTEYEWQQAATGGNPNESFPWGEEWDAQRCNTAESGLNRTTAVGLYPAGASSHGVVDLSGNLWEWCLNKNDETGETVIDDSGDQRVLRGGSWHDDRGYAGARLSATDSPDHGGLDVGFRVLCTSPVAGEI